jgi:hypothetical protein
MTYKQSTSLEQYKYTDRLLTMVNHVARIHKVLAMCSIQYSIQRFTTIQYGFLVPVYRLRDWVTRVRFLAEAKDFSCSICVQTSSVAHPASYPMGNGGPFPGGKARPGMTLTTHPHLMPRSRMSRGYTSSPPCYQHANSRTALLFIRLHFWYLSCSWDETVDCGLLVSGAM